MIDTSGILDVGKMKARNPITGLHLEWSNDEWLCFLDGWAGATLGLATPTERKGYREAWREYGRQQAVKAAAAS